MNQAILYMLLISILFINGCALMRDPGTIAKTRYKERLRDYDLNQKIPLRKFIQIHTLHMIKKSFIVVLIH